jgi:hypothetical protein
MISLSPYLIGSYMAKFYIQSGDLKVVAQGEDFLTTVLGVLSDVLKYSPDMELGKTLSVSERGFSTDLVGRGTEGLFNGYVRVRKKNMRVVTVISPDIEMERGQTLFLPRDQLIELISREEEK